MSIMCPVSSVFLTCPAHQTCLDAVFGDTDIPLAGGDNLCTVFQADRVPGIVGTLNLSSSSCVPRYHPRHSACRLWGHKDQLCNLISSLPLFTASFRDLPKVRVMSRQLLELIMRVSTMYLQDHGSWGIFILLTRHDQSVRRPTQLHHPQRPHQELAVGGCKRR